MSGGLRGAAVGSPSVSSTRRRWGSLALGTSVVALVVATVGAGFAGSPVAAAPTSSSSPDSTVPDSTVPESTDPTTTTPTTTTTTTTTIPLPDPGAAVVPPSAAGLPSDADRCALPTSTATPITVTLPADCPRGVPEQATPTLPPPTTTVPPNPCADTAVPANSGSGKRLVYSKGCQRVWIVEADESVTRTYLVSGRLRWDQPTRNNPANNFEPAARFYADPPAYYRVWSQSSYTCNIKRPYICWRYMVRFTKGPEGDNIGFHQIPVNTKTGNTVQSVSQLGTALSSGCVRQSPDDAFFLWMWVRNGDRVVVV